MSEVTDTKEASTDDELCSFMIGDGEGRTYSIPSPPIHEAVAVKYCVRLTIGTDHAFNTIVRATNEVEAYERAEKCTTRHVAKMEILRVGEPENHKPEAMQPTVNEEKFRMVEWEGIGNVVFAVNESKLVYDDLLDLLQACSRIGVRGYQFYEEDLENDGPLPSLLKVLCRLIVIRDLYHCDALGIFSSGGYSDLLPPLMGQNGIRLTEVDTSESGLHSLFLGKPYSA